jgi:hypothetical protein
MLLKTIKFQTGLNISRDGKTVFELFNHRVRHRGIQQALKLAKAEALFISRVLLKQTIDLKKDQECTIHKALMWPRHLLPLRKHRKSYEGKQALLSLIF